MAAYKINDVSLAYCVLLKWEAMKRLAIQQAIRQSIKDNAEMITVDDVGNDYVYISNNDAYLRTKIGSGIVRMRVPAGAWFVKEKKI